MKKKKKKIILIVILSIVVLLILIPVIITRSFFIKAFILPKVSESIGVPLTCESISLNPFSSVEINDLVLGDEESPALKAHLVKCRFSLLSIMGGTIKIDEVAVSDVNTKLIQKQNGEWNLPLMNKSAKKSKSGGTTTGSQQGTKSSPVLDLTNISIKNFNAHIIQEGKTPEETKEIVLNNVSLEIPTLKNDGNQHSIILKGNSSKIYFNNLKIDNGNLNIETKLALNEKLLPQLIELNAVLSELKGSANKISLNGHELIASLETDMGDNGAINIKSLKLTETHEGQPSATIKLNGVLNPDPFNIKADLLVGPVTPNAFNLIGAIIGDFDLGKTNAAYSASFSFDAKQNLDVKGKLLVNDFTMVSEKMKLARLQPMKLSVVHDIAGNLQHKMIQVNKFQIDLANSDQKLLDLAVSEPFSLSMDEKASSKGKAPKVILQCYEFPVSMVNAVADTGIKSGNLNAKIVAVLGELGKAIDINGNINIENLAMKRKGLTLSKSNVRQSINATLTDFKKFKINQAETKILTSNKKALDMQLHGDLDIATMEGTFITQIYDVNENLITLLPEETIKKLPEKFNLKARIKTILKGTRDINASCEIGISNLRPANIANQENLPLNADCKMDASYKDDIASVESFILKLNSPSKQIALLKGSALYHINPDDGVCKFDLEASGINIKTIKDLIPEEAGTPNTETASSTGKEPQTEPQSEPGPLDLKGLQLLGKISLKNITYEKANISEGDAVIKISNNKMHIKPFKLIVNDSKMNGEGFVDLGVKGFKYDITTGVKELPVDTFVSIFQPDFQGSLSGGIKTFDFQLKGRGVSKKNLTDNLTANGAFELNNIQIEDMEFQNILTDSFESELLKDLASLAVQNKEETNKILKFLDLKKMGFKDGVFKFDILKGVIRSDTFNLVGKNHYISGKGGFNIFDKSLKDVRFDLGMSEKLAKKIGLKKEYLDAFDKENDFYFLPAELGFSGKYPDIEFEYKDAVNGIVIGTVKNIGISKLKEKVPIGGEILEELLKPKKDKDGKKKKTILDELFK